MTTHNKNKLPDQYGPKWHIWESSVARTQTQLSNAERLDNAIIHAGLDLDLGRLYRITSAQDEALQTVHARFSLAPYSRSSHIADIVKVVVRVPLIEPQQAPAEFRRAYIKSDAGRYGDLSEKMPTNDIFLEAYKEGQEPQRFIMRPEGMRAYSNAGDIFDLEANDIEKTGQFYDVRPTLDSMIIDTANGEWPTMEEFNHILHVYEPFPQETTGPLPRSNVA